MDINTVVLGVIDMTHKDRGHYAGKHPEDQKVNPEVTEAVKQTSSDGEISCAEAFRIAEDFNVPPGEVGFAIDSLEITMVKCQLGLYGYQPEKRIVKPAESVSDNLEEAIREALKEGRLPCRAAWDIAKSMGKRKMEISSACEALKIKISRCQLGAF